MEERREFPRPRTLKSGRIVDAGSGSAFDCTIRNLNRRGALLMVASPTGIPDSFELTIEPDAHHVCRVKWRGEDRLGVMFT